MTTKKNTLLLGLFLLFALTTFAQEYPIFRGPLPQQEEEQVVELEFSVQGGYHNIPFHLEIYSPEAKIFYTTDGRRPSYKSTRYRKPIEIKQTTIIRAIAYKGRKKSTVVGHTYFFNQAATKIPTVSISLPSDILFDPEKGMFVKGYNAIDTIWSLPGANFWSRSEVRVNTEIFEADGRCVFRSESGLRLFGGMSRLFPQKSLVLVTRERYGQKHVKHRIFGKKGLKKYKFLVLRNSGSDFGKTHFRDALMTGLVNKFDLDKQDYRPAHVYINGDYWGIYNIREKVNRYFIDGHHRTDKDSVDLIEHRYTRKRGSKLHYLKMIKFLENNDLSLAENFAYLQSQMEVNNFMDFQIAQIYFDNQDAGGNIKFWREHSPNGRWRWILYDTDWGFGLHDATAYKNNSLAFHTEPNGPKWPNPPWSTFILRKLLENKEFEKAFINRFADYINTAFKPERIQKHIDRYYNTLVSEIPRHHQRWRLSSKTWENQVQILRNFADRRPAYMLSFLEESFDLGYSRDVNIEVSNGGTVIVNNNLEIKKSMQGQYFEKLPITIQAVPDFGYRFSHWEGIEMNSGLREMTLLLTEESYNIKAVFEKYKHPLVNQLVINEISANNSKSGDWVELFNYSKKQIELEDWILTDRKNEFFFPNVSIAPNDYLVICQDSSKFFERFPRSYNVVPNMGFGINKWRETLGLFSPDGAAVDSMGYLIEPTDSVFTFNLLLPYLDNSNMSNWELRPGEGSPNMPNPYYVESTIRQEQELWMQIGTAATIFFICLLLLVWRSRGII